MNHNFTIRLFRRLMLPILFGFVFFSACANAVAFEIHVAIDGGTEADGSISKPYPSLPDAVDAVRALRKSGNVEPATIYLRAGRHQLNQTLVLDLQDGRGFASAPIAETQYGVGEPQAPAFLTIAAFPGEAPVVSSGIPVTGWQPLENEPAEIPDNARGKVWVADLPDGLQRFHTLYNERGRLNRARDRGFVPTKTGDKRTLHFPAGAIKNWDNVSDVEIQVRPSKPWVTNMLPLATVDEVSSVATTGVSATYEIGALPPWVHNPSGSTVWIENVIEALDEPGEWVVNTDTRKVYLWPTDPAADGSPRGILAPTTSELIRVEGAIDYQGPKDEPVVGIAFSGLTFTHADRLAWTTDETRLGWGMQHDWDMFDRPSAMLRFRGATECCVTQCKFLDSGGTGLRFDLHAQRNRVEDCEFAHLGEAGILLAGYGPGTKDVNRNNEILNNHIHHFSEISWHSPGIWAWQSGHNRIANNYIHHSGYAAVLITNRIEPDRQPNAEGGRTVRHHEIPDADRTDVRESYENWKVREKYNHSRHNLLEYNEITHSVQLLSDGNAIYVSGAGTGNVVRYNYVHDNVEPSLPSAIRCDDDQHEVTIHGNVLCRNFGFAAGIASKGINDITNNFIVAPLTSPKWGYVSFEWTRVTGSNVQGNIIVSHPSGGKAYGERPLARTQDGDPLVVETAMDGNLYYHPHDPAWMDAHFEKMHAVGKEKASLFGDPLFVDPEREDFSFQPGSPALALGIEELDVSKMGLQKNEALCISDGSRFEPQKCYPKFSWDATPMYYMFGDSDRLLTPEEVTFIAERTDFICIEKSHGLNELGAAELGAKHESAAFKKANPDIKVLFYFNSAWAWPFTSYNKNFRRKTIDKHPELKRFLLFNPKKGKLNQRRNTYSFDVLNPEFRPWWVDTVAKGVEESNCDGAFIDQMHGFAWLREGRSDEVQIAQGELMGALKKKLGPEKILLGNNAHTDIAKHVFPVVDANMFEHFDKDLLSKEKMLEDWADMLRIAKAGKMSVFRIGIGMGRFPIERTADNRGLARNERRASLAYEKLEYYQACFLIGAQPYSYFQYGWGWTLSDGSLYDFPELQNRLGAPTGAYQRMNPDGWEFTREFDHASVWVDTEKGLSKITWR